MATATSRIRLEIEARLEGFRDAVRGAIVQLRLLQAAVRDNQRVLDGVGRGIGRFLKAVAAIGAIGNVVGGVAALATSLSNLVPIIALAPAAIFTLVAAVATFKLATAGFADAVKGDADVMAKLAPSARETAKAIQDLKPRFEELRKAVQQEFFKNFAADVKTLANTYLPVLQARLPRIAAAFNGMGRSITRALTTNGASADIDKALENTAKFLENARNAAGHLVAGLVPLIAFGSTYIPDLGRAIDGAADRFRAWSQRVTADGSLRDWVDGAIREFGFLRDLIGNVGEVFDAVFRGLSTGANQDFLQAMADSTQALADFLNQADSQETLKALGKAFSEIATVTREVFLEALKQIFPILKELAPVVAEVARVVGDLLVNAMKILGPILEQVARFLNDNKEAVADLAPLVLGLWAAFKGASILATVTPALTRLGTALGGPIGILKAGGIIALGALAVKINDINQETAKIENRPLNDMEDTLSDLVGAGREILTLDFDGIFSDIQSEVQETHDKFTSGQSFFGEWSLKLKAATESGLQSVKDLAKGIGEFFSVTLLEKGTALGKSIEDALKSAADGVKNFFTTTVPTLVSDFFKSIGNGISTGSSNIGTTVSDAFTTVVDTVKAKIQEVTTSTSDFLKKTPYEMGRAIGDSIGRVLKSIEDFGVQLHDKIVAAMTDFSDQIKIKIDEAVTFAQELPGRIGAAISDLTTTLATKAQEAGQQFLDWLNSFFTKSSDRAGEVPGQVGTAVSGTVDQLRDKAIQAGAEFVAGLVTKFNEAVTFVQQAPGKIGSAVSAVVGILRDKAVEAGSSFLTGLQAKFDEAVAYVKSIPSRLSAAIGNLGTLLVSQGKSLIDGLVAGIKQGYAAARDFVSGIADGLAAVKGPLSYDKIVMRPAGLALMSGLTDGLRAGAADALAFTSTLAGALATSATAGLTGASPLAGVGAAASSTAALTEAVLARLPSSSSNADTPVQVRVFIGETELTDLVRVEVAAAATDTATRVRAGTGVSFG
jgi:phage-related protein